MLYLNKFGGEGLKTVAFGPSFHKAKNLSFFLQKQMNSFTLLKISIMKTIKFILFLSISFLVLPKAHAQFTANFGVDLLVDNCTAWEYQFTDSSTTSPTFGASYYWDFGDNTTSTLQNPTHWYYLPGTYTIIHVVSANGVSITSTQDLIVTSCNI